MRRSSVVRGEKGGVSTPTTSDASDITRACFSCQSSVESEFERIALNCRKHFVCRECLRRKAVRDAQSMWVCFICTPVPVYSAPEHVFVDHDNLLLEAMKLKAGSFSRKVDDHRVRIDYRRLGDFIAKERIITGRVYNCRPAIVKDERFTLALSRASDNTGGQKEVDTGICVDIMDALTCDTRSTVALVGGDRDILPALKKALEAGWRVKIYMWECSTSMDLKKLPQAYKNCTFVPLDENFENIYRCYYATSTTETETSVVLFENFKCDKNGKIYEAHSDWWKKMEQAIEWPVQYKWIESVQLRYCLYMLDKPRLLLVFKDLTEAEARDKLLTIPTLSDDGSDRERAPEIYSDFRERIEQQAILSSGPSTEWSQASSRCSTPRHTPKCCLGKNCEDGLKCQLAHSSEDKEYFGKNRGKGFYWRKTKLCNVENCPHSKDIKKCNFAHGKEDGWCRNCHKRGHFYNSCKNPACKSQKHILESTMQRLHQYSPPTTSDTTLTSK